MVSLIKQIYNDETLYGHSLTQIPAQSWTTSRVGSAIFSACTAITILPLGFAIKVIHALGRYLAGKLRLCTYDSSFTVQKFLSPELALTLQKDILSQAQISLTRINSARFFLNVTCDKTSYCHDYIFSSHREKKYDKAAINAHLNTIIKETLLSFEKSTPQKIEFKWHFLSKDVQGKFAEAWGRILRDDAYVKEQRGTPHIDLKFANHFYHILSRMDRQEKPILDEENNFIYDDQTGALIRDDSYL